MDTEGDPAFGQLAMSLGFCTKEQVDWCRAIQATSKEQLSLGRILAAEGYLSETEHSQILELQRETPASSQASSAEEKGASLFGKLAIREGLLTEAKLSACLTLQAAEVVRRSLGEIMTTLGFLTAEQVKGLLGKQEKRIMSCPTCILSFTVLSISRVKKVVCCPRCKGFLQEGKPSASTRTDGEFATQVLRIAKSELSPASKSKARPIPVGAVKIKTRCVICDQLLEGIPDSTRRLRCPVCNTTFVPK